jgi:hypothetical protein
VYSETQNLLKYCPISQSHSKSVYEHVLEVSLLEKIQILQRPKLQSRLLMLVIQIALNSSLASLEKGFAIHGIIIYFVFSYITCLPVKNFNCCKKFFCMCVSNLRNMRLLLIYLTG